MPDTYMEEWIKLKRKIMAQKLCNLTRDERLRLIMRLKNVQIKRLKSWQFLSKEIGLSYMALRRFMEIDNPQIPSELTMQKIVAFIEKNEIV